MPPTPKSDVTEYTDVAKLTPLSDQEYRLICDLIYTRFGIDLGEQKKSLVAGRLNKVLKQLDFKDFNTYYEYVASDNTGQALTTLVNRISTNHTFFYREPDHFQFFYDTVLPEVVEILKSQNRKDLHVWCPGCSTGEEPYTLAMLICEYFANQLSCWNPGILATDISRRVLEKAKTGVFEDDNVNRLPHNLKNKYFTQVSEENWEIQPRLKNMVLFRALNLMRKDFPFKRKFQVIFCRNVMIYFDQSTRDKLVTQFSRYLDHGGYLFIGHSESLGRENKCFNYIRPAVYRKVSSV